MRAVHQRNKKDWAPIPKYSGALILWAGFKKTVQKGGASSEAVHNYDMSYPIAVPRSVQHP